MAFAQMWSLSWVKVPQAPPALGRSRFRPQGRQCAGWGAVALGQSPTPIPATQEAGTQKTACPGVNPPAGAAIQGI